MIDSIANVDEFDKLKNTINERQSQFTIASFEKRKQNVEKKINFKLILKKHHSMKIKITKF